MLELTQAAKLRIKDIILEENNPKLSLRTFVHGGGCSGMSYGFTLDEDMNEDDFEVPFDEFRVLVDAVSMQYLSLIHI